MSVTVPPVGTSRSSLVPFPIGQSIHPPVPFDPQQYIGVRKSVYYTLVATVASHAARPRLRLPFTGPFPPPCNSIATSEAHQTRMEIRYIPLDHSRYLRLRYSGEFPSSTHSIPVLPPLSAWARTDVIPDPAPCRALSRPPPPLLLPPYPPTSANKPLPLRSRLHVDTSPPTRPPTHPHRP